MEDEIKEILNKLLEYFKESNINNFGYEQDKLISYEEAQIILNYITKLQEENEKLNNKIHDITETLNETYNNRTELRNENERLKEELELEKSICSNQAQRIKKTVDYIENDMPYLEEPDEEFERCDGTSYMTMKEYDTSYLLNILKGEENE